MLSKQCPQTTSDGRECSARTHKVVVLVERTHIIPSSFAHGMFSSEKKTELPLVKKTNSLLCGHIWGKKSRGRRHK